MTEHDWHLLGSIREYGLVMFCSFVVGYVLGAVVQYVISERIKGHRR